MPEAVAPPSASKEEIDLIDVLTSRVRAVLLHELSHNGPQTTTQLHPSVGGNRSSLLRHLVDLEDVGLVKGSPGRATRANRTVIWYFQPDAAAAFHRRYGAYLFDFD